ncbi:MAG: hypothetical protein NTX64_07900 [Elusimicrobia bacterium]|nr:hypothetical protein [Elusimicrobiota bacterium]
MRFPFTAKFAVSLALILVSTAILLKQRHAWERDDEETDAEEAIERAEGEQAKEAGACGVERWAVKTLSDSQAGQVNFTPADTTVDHLASYPSDGPWGGFSTGRNGIAHQMPPDTRYMSGEYAENQVYRVHAKLLRYKRESDKDYHLVLADSRTGATIIAEISDPKCPGAESSPYRGDLENVRGQFDSTFSKPTTHFTDAGGVPVTVTGVRFFDHNHGQNGVAPNATELHPILCVSRGDGC